MCKTQVLPLDLAYLGLDAGNPYYQLSVAGLVTESLLNQEGRLAESGALAVDTGRFTGRSPKDRFIVYDDITRDTVFWGDVNVQFDAHKFELLQQQMTKHLTGLEKFYVRDGYACAEQQYQLSLRVITETAYQNLFSAQLFLRYDDLPAEKPEWTIIASPSFSANPAESGTRQTNFTIINFTTKMILIGGTGYTGEIKKGIFSVLNFLLPERFGILPMHCSANVGERGDTAIFFGLSGTGKTTLSADPARRLIGDDEHGWSEESVFNFEGGCYAKCAGLSSKKEPEIYNAIRFGSLLENINFFEGSAEVDFSDISKTENTRVAYPLDYVQNAQIPSIGKSPENIFLLTADAFGVLPPISKLSIAQAMFHFISGYTSKLAGTETGVTEPQTTFSACFGKAFLPLHPARYANMLGKKLAKGSINVWLINTGWTGGSYGKGTRMRLSYTRAMIRAAMSGQLSEVSYETDPVFGLSMPVTCPGVPSAYLNPRNTWTDEEAYDSKAAQLNMAFKNNYRQFEHLVGKL